LVGMNNVMVGLIARLILVAILNFLFVSYHNFNDISSNRQTGS